MYQVCHTQNLECNYPFRDPKKRGTLSRRIDCDRILTGLAGDGIGC